MTDDDYTSDIYNLFWNCLIYFIGFVLLAMGYLHSWQNWIYYGLFMCLLGVLYNISARVIRIEDLLTGADIKFELLYDDD